MYFIANDYLAFQKRIPLKSLPHNGFLYVVQSISGLSIHVPVLH